MAKPLLFRWREAFLSEDGPRGTVRLVLLVLATHMNQDGGSCYPGQRTIAAEAGISTSSLYHALQEARQEGWIEVVEREGNWRGGPRLEYRPAFPPHLESGTEDEPLTGQGTDSGADTLPPESDSAADTVKGQGTDSATDTLRDGSDSAAERTDSVAESKVTRQPSRSSSRVLHKHPMEHSTRASARESTPGQVSLKDELPDPPEGWKPPEQLASAEGLLQGFNPEDHQVALALYRERHQTPIEGLSRRDLDMLPREDLDRLAFRVASRQETP